jgi:hypothetical protein
MFKFIDIKKLHTPLTKVDLLNHISYYQAKKGYFRKLWLFSSTKWPAVSWKMENLITFTNSLSSYTNYLSKAQKQKLASLTLHKVSKSLTASIFKRIHMHDRFTPIVSPRTNSTWAYFKISVAINVKSEQVACIEIPYITSRSFESLNNNYSEDLFKLARDIAHLLEGIANKNFIEKEAHDIRHAINLFISRLNRAKETLSILRKNSQIFKNDINIRSALQDSIITCRSVFRINRFLKVIEQFISQRIIANDIKTLLHEENLVFLIMDQISPITTWKENLLFLLVQKAPYLDQIHCPEPSSESDIICQSTWDKFRQPFVDLKIRLQGVMGLEEEENPDPTHVVRRL